MHRVIEQALEEKRNPLEPEVLNLFADYGLPAPAYVFATSCAEAVAGAERLGYPVVLKVVSAKIVHKSEAGGVKLNLASAEDVERAYQSVLNSVAAFDSEAAIAGVLIEKQAAKGVECIVGILYDEQFGHCAMFGLGGVAVELFQDVSFRVVPLTREDAKNMIAETKASKLLNGFRGELPKDVEAIVDVLKRVSAMIRDNPQIKELDINPLMVYEQGAIILDGRVLL
ncbi:MAG: acetyl-CoA synthetase [Clostridiales bacterium]|nr:acetyl-CoA synthetase [Clostridiales bacterium]